jgi:hypothetical protein
MTRRTSTMRGVGRARYPPLPALLTVVAVCLVGCGGPSGKAANGDSSSPPNLLQAFSDAYAKSFNQAFDRTTHDACLPSAEAHGATADQAESYCTCVVAQLEPLSVADKQKLNSDPAKLQAAAAACQPQAQ